MLLSAVGCAPDRVLSRATTKSQEDAGLTPVPHQTVTPLEVLPTPADAPAQPATPPDTSEMTGVMFSWEETDPRKKVACKAGHYVGTYMCRLFIVVTEGEGAFDVSGTVDLVLEQSANGELFRVQNGKFNSATLAAIPVRADVLGELDCSAGKFDGRLERGVFSVALDLGIPFTEGMFSGPLTADYDQTTAALTGTWNMQGELDGFPGSCMNGSWSAAWQE